LDLILGGLHQKHAVWVGTEHLLEGSGKPLSTWPVAGPSGCRLPSDQQSEVQQTNPNSSPHCAVAYMLRTYRAVNTLRLRYTNQSVNAV